MATTIRVGVDGGAVSTIDDIRQRAKQLSADLKDAQREIQATARAGQTVSKEVSDNYKSIRQQFENTKEFAKEQAKLEKSMENAGRNFTRGDVRKLMALKELAEGNVSPHSIRHATELLSEHGVPGMAKIADTLANISGPLMVGKMALDFGMEVYKKETERITREAHFESKIIDEARTKGFAPELRQKLEKTVKKAILFSQEDYARGIYEKARMGKATGGAEAVQEYENMDLLTRRLMEKAKADRKRGIEINDEYKEKLYDETFREVETARKHATELGVSPDSVIAKLGRNATNEQFNKEFDAQLQATMEKNHSLIERLAAKDKEINDKEINERLRKERDPIYRATQQFIEHEKKMRAEVDFQVRHKRYANPNPVDF